MALTERLERLASDPALLIRLQRAGEQRVKTHFSVDASARQLETMLSFNLIHHALIPLPLHQYGPKA